MRDWSRGHAALLGDGSKGVWADGQVKAASDIAVQFILGRLVERSVNVLPISAAGVVIDSPGRRSQFASVSNGSELACEQIHPGLPAPREAATSQLRSGLRPPHLCQHGRWPPFTAEAQVAGQAPTIVFSLRHGDEQFGAVHMFVQEGTPLDADNLALAQAMVGVASVHLVGAHRSGELDGFTEQSLEKSLYDELTGLPNRNLLLDHLDHALDPDSPSVSDVALLFVEVDDLDTINARYGRLRGDEVLVEVGKRLWTLGQAGDVVARLAGAEFVILCQRGNSSLDMEMMAEQVRLALAVPFNRGGEASMIAARVGSARLARPAAPDIRGLAGPKSGQGSGMWWRRQDGGRDQQQGPARGLGKSRR